MGFKELEYFGATQLLADHNGAGGINTVDLEHRLGEINPNRDSIHSGWLLSRWTLRQRPLYGASTPVAGAIHPISLMLNCLCFPYLSGSLETILWANCRSNGIGFRPI